MFVGVCRLELRIVGNSSLKGKRKIVRSTIDRTRSKFNVAVAEVGNNDDHRSALIGAVVVGNTAAHVDAMVGRISSFVESLALAPVTRRETEVIPLGDNLGSSLGDAGGDEEWGGAALEGEEDEW